MTTEGTYFEDAHPELTKAEGPVEDRMYKAYLRYWNLKRTSPIPEGHHMTMVTANAVLADGSGVDNPDDYFGGRPGETLIYRYPEGEFRKVLWGIGELRCANLKVSEIVRLLIDKETNPKA